MATGELATTELESVKNEWLARLRDLVMDVQGWAEGDGWQARTTTKSLVDAELGRYEVPILLLQRGEVEVALSPIARKFPGADGAVDLYLMPAYDDVASLYAEGKHWFVHDVPFHDPQEPHSIRSAERSLLSSTAIKQVLNAIADHAQSL